MIARRRILAAFTRSCLICVLGHVCFIGASTGPSFAQSESCIFLLDCKETPRKTPEPVPPEPKPPEKKCDQRQGNYIVVNVPWGDADNGLLIRASPTSTAQIKGVIPAAAVGVDVSNCQGNWCQVTYGCETGWAGSRFLSERSNELRRVVGVSLSDPEGLNIRTGPGPTFPKNAEKRSIPANADGVINHTCQASPVDRTSWCLVTYRNYSGWVAGRFLSR